MLIELLSIQVPIKISRWLTRVSASVERIISRESDEKKHFLDNDLNVADFSDCIVDASRSDLRESYCI